MDIFYVTGFWKPQNHQIHRDIDKYLGYFELLAQSNINIGVYLDPSLIKRFAPLTKAFTNIKIIELLEVDRSFIKDISVILPENRNVSKDSEDYMLIQLMKLKCMSRAAINPNITEPILAWIDFGVFHIFKDIKHQQRLLATMKFAGNTNKIYVPGCWNLDRSSDIWKNISWRYCGGFLIGKRELFIEAYRQQLQVVVANLPKLTWEVNYWTLMNVFEWYRADHDDTLLKFTFD